MNNDSINSNKRSKASIIVTDIIIFYRVLMETIKGITQAGMMNIFIIGTMAAILTIFGCIFRTSIALGSVVKELGKVLEISVYLKPDANLKDAVFEVRNIPSVDRINVIPKQKAWTNFRKTVDLPNIENHLPDTLHVRVKSQKDIKQVAKSIEGLKEVEDVKYAHELAEKMREVSDISHTATIIILIVSGFLTMFIINNTIQIVIASKRKEIEIMRLMGVSDWYIRMPLVLQGAFYGLSGTLIAIIPVLILQRYIDKTYEFFAVPQNPMTINVVIATILFMGVVFCACGSFVSIKKHLNI